VIPFLEYAEREGFSVIVLNPNLNRDHSGGVVRHNDSAERHCYYVWKKFISRVPEELYVVGHSCGGLCTVSLLHKLDKEFIQRVKAIALTDSVHFGVNQCSQEAQKYFAEVAVDWVASRAPLDEVVRGLETSIK
jgi:alpha-beta hydrolase superfamily lysophospholipase